MTDRTMEMEGSEEPGGVGWGPSSELSFEVAARTHVGRRSNNEDALLVDRGHGVFLVADGMGGYEGGEVASRLVVETVRGFFERNARDAETTWPFGLEAGRSFVENLARVALLAANRQVAAQRHGRLAKMGSTAALAALDADRVVLAHVGDSRVYRLRDGRLEQLTRDHSLVEEMRAMGMRESPEGIGHVVTRAIGMRDMQPDLHVETLRPGDTLLLCSDGLSDPLEDAAIARELSRAHVEDACDGLVHAAYGAGGTDNITALVLRFGYPPAPEAARVVRRADAGACGPARRSEPPR